MSTALRRTAPRKPAADDAAPPFVGALLRLCWQSARRRIDAAIREAGFADLQDSHLLVFQYPVPDGMRPSVLARQIRMSRQATNYLVAQLEELGYLERRAGPDRTRRLIYLTARGRRVVQTIYACSRALQQDWAADLGTKRFDGFMATLRDLAKQEQDAKSAD